MDGRSTRYLLAKLSQASFMVERYVAEHLNIVLIFSFKL